MLVALLAQLPLSQWPGYLLGGCGILLEWRAYGLHSGGSFRRWSAAAAIFWSGQYFLLGATTAALTMACTALRTLSSQALSVSHFKQLAVIGFFSMFILLTGISWQGTVSLLPAFAVLNTTWALFYFGNRHMRLALLASSVAWIANDVIWQAWPALLAETIAMIINLRTIRQMPR